MSRISTDDRLTIDAANVVINAACGNGYALPNEFSGADMVPIVTLARTIVRLGSIIDTLEEEILNDNMERSLAE